METLMDAAAAAGAAEDMPLKAMKGSTRVRPARHALGPPARLDARLTPAGKPAVAVPRTRTGRTAVPAAALLDTGLAAPLARPATAPPARTPLAPRTTNPAAPAARRPSTPGKAPWRVVSRTAEVPHAPPPPASLLAAPLSAARPHTADPDASKGAHRTDRVKRHQALTRTWASGTAYSSGTASAVVPLASRRDEAGNFHLRFAEAHAAAEKQRRRALESGRRKHAARRTEPAARVPW